MRCIIGDNLTLDDPVYEVGIMVKRIKFLIGIYRSNSNKSKALLPI